MISSRFKRGRKSRVCDNLKAIENYTEAFNDPEWVWECHHRDEHEKGLSAAELVGDNQYYHLHPSRLIYLPRLIHSLTHYLGYIPDKRYWGIWLNPPFVNLTTQRLGDIIDLMTNATMGCVRTPHETFKTSFSSAVKRQLEYNQRRADKNKAKHEEGV